MVRRYLKKRNNPWEILVIAALFFFPGVFMLLQHGPLVTFQQVYKYTYLLPSGVIAISERGAHIFGSLAVGGRCHLCMGLLLVTSFDCARY